MCMFIMFTGDCRCSTHAVVSHLQVNGDAFLAKNRAEFRLLKEFREVFKMSYHPTVVFILYQIAALIQSG